MAALAHWPAHVPILEVLVLESGAVNIRARGQQPASAKRALRAAGWIPVVGGSWTLNHKEKP